MQTLHGVIYSIQQHSYDSTAGDAARSPHNRRSYGYPDRSGRFRPHNSRLWSLIPLFIFFCSTLYAQISSHVVISEVYGGGGNAGSVYKQDFIELYNPSPDPVVMTNWSIQYASSSGTFSAGNRTVFSGTIQPRSFFLVQEAQGSGGTLDLPAPDVVGTVALASTNGKIALVSDTLLATGPSDVHVIDFIGYGSANQYEGAGAVPALGNTVSAERKAVGSSTDSTMGAGGIDEFNGNGWDSDNNATDVVRRSVQVPQNSSSAPEVAPGAMETISCAYGQRWNLVSLSVLVPDRSCEALFPGAASTAFGYADGYTPEDTLRAGAGYWLKFSAPALYSWTGVPRTGDGIALVAGWNLIGCWSAPASVPLVMTDPPGILATPFYQYADGYTQADSLVPGFGYWVKSASPGTLKFPAVTAQRNNTITIR